MKKRTKIILAALVATVIGGSIYMINEKDNFHNLFGRKVDLRTTQEKQLDYLKEHEDEIKDFVKSQNPKIESVQIDWDKTQWDQIGNGTPWGAGEIIDIYGRFNNIENSGWHVMIDIPKGEFNISAMTLVNGLGVGGKPFE